MRCGQIIIRNVELFSDSKLALELLIEDYLVFHRYASIITWIKRLMRRDWVVSCSHLLCEGNATADFFG